MALYPGIDITQSPDGMASMMITSSLLSSTSGPAIVDASNDVYEDCCSICLDPFNSQNPPTFTTCKHEYHLQCILDWSQRSKECPICLQVMVLIDPSCQDLLADVGRERSIRSRSYVHPRLHDNDISNDHFVFSHSRRHEPDGLMDPELSLALPSIADGIPNTVDNSDGPLKHRLSFKMSPFDGPSRSSSSELQSLSESVKAKLSSASARYKESFSKSTRGFKEKILARNTSVKEMSKGVQRGMSASISRVIERLDLPSIS